MKADENTSQFECGEVLKAYEAAPALVYGGLVFFALIGGYLFWDMLQDQSMIGKLDNALLLLFCLWRMHRCRDVLCYVTERGLVVRRKAESFADYWKMQRNEAAAYVFIEYEYIVAFRSTWREIEVGMPTEGGISLLSAELAFLTKKAKAEILKTVREQKEKKE